MSVGTSCTVTAAPAVPNRSSGVCAASDAAADVASGAAPCACGKWFYLRGLFCFQGVK